MDLKVKLYSLLHESDQSQYVSSLSAAKDDTFVAFRFFLENERLIDFDFDT